MENKSAIVIEPHTSKRWIIIIDSAFGIFVSGIAIYVIAAFFLIISRKIITGNIIQKLLSSSTFGTFIMLTSVLAELAYIFLFIVLFVFWQKHKFKNRFKLYWTVVLITLLPHLFIWFITIVFAFGDFNLQF